MAEQGISATVYIRKEDIEDWKKVENKSEIVRWGLAEWRKRQRMNNNSDNDNDNFYTS